MSMRRDQDGSRDKLKTGAQLAGPTTRKASESGEENERCCRKVMTM
jgi:hypothetical protein